MRLPLLIVAMLALAGCGPSEPVAPVQATPPSEPAAEAVAPTPTTFPVTVDQAQARWDRIDPLKRGDLMAPNVGVKGMDCWSHMGRRLSVRICSVGGQVSDIFAMSRGGADLALLDQAVVAMADLVAPDAEPADIARIKREARAGLERGGTTLCPTTVCFRVFVMGDDFVLGTGGVD